MKLIKSSSNKVITGVCGGISNYLNIDSTIVRIGFAVSAVFSLGTTAIVYLVLALLMPNDEYLY